MTVIYQSRIYRADLQRNPQVLYVFGDNYTGVGLGGQAKEMRYEPNAVGIPTKKNPGGDRFDFLYDVDIEAFKEIIIPEINRLQVHIFCGGVVVFPSDGIGTGLARLAETSPKCWESLNTLLRTLDIQNGEGETS